LAATGLLAPVAQAGTLKVVNGAAVFRAAPGEVNDILAGTKAAGSSAMMIDRGAPVIAGAGCAQIDASSAYCPGVAPDSPLIFWTGDGDDRVTLSDRLARPTSELHGEAGNDTLHVGQDQGSDPLIDGGIGDDALSASMNMWGTPVLLGGRGNDSLTLRGDAGGGELYGDANDDTLIDQRFSRSEPVRLDGGAGNDSYVFNRGWLPTDITRLVAGTGTDTVDFSALGRDASVDLSACPGCVERVIGSAFDDQITGGSVREEIQGGAGNDTLDGGGGRDVLFGQEGDDTISARDRVADAISCEDGFDSVFADRIGIDVVSADCESVIRG
jgi:Ca2+-binding RTX toxin-like protein